MWNASSKEECDSEENLAFYLKDRNYPENCAGCIQPYADSPFDGEQVGEEVYISMVNKAERYCYFMRTYLIITDELAHALSLVSKHGVDVRIFMPGIPDKKPIYRVMRSFYNVPAENGVRIFEWKPGFCHAKMIVADDRLAMCGTINLDYRSLYHHFENGCFMTDVPDILSIKEDFDETFKQCREVTEKYSIKWSVPHRLSRMIIRLFSQLL